MNKKIVLAIGLCVGLMGQGFSASRPVPAGGLKPASTSSPTPGTRPSTRGAFSGENTKAGVDSLPEAGAPRNPTGSDAPGIPRGGSSRTVVTEAESSGLFGAKTGARQVVDDPGTNVMRKGSEEGGDSVVRSEVNDPAVMLEAPSVRDVAAQPEPVVKQPGDESGPDAEAGSSFKLVKSLAAEKGVWGAVKEYGLFTTARDMLRVRTANKKIEAAEVLRQGAGQAGKMLVTASKNLAQTAEEAALAARAMQNAREQLPKEKLRGPALEEALVGTQKALDKQASVVRQAATSETALRDKLGKAQQRKSAAEQAHSRALNELAAAERPYAKLTDQRNAADAMIQTLTPEIQVQRETVATLRRAQVERTEEVAAQAALAADAVAKAKVATDNVATCRNVFEAASRTWAEALNPFTVSEKAKAKKALAEAEKDLVAARTALREATSLLASKKEAQRQAVVAATSALSSLQAAEARVARAREIRTAADAALNDNAAVKAAQNRVQQEAKQLEKTTKAVDSAQTALDAQIKTSQEVSSALSELQRARNLALEEHATHLNRIDYYSQVLSDGIINYDLQAEAVSRDVAAVRKADKKGSKLLSKVSSVVAEANQALQAVNDNRGKVKSAREKTVKEIEFEKRAAPVKALHKMMKASAKGEPVTDEAIVQHVQKTLRKEAPVARSAEPAEASVSPAAPESAPVASSESPAATPPAVSQATRQAGTRGGAAGETPRPLVRQDATINTLSSAPKRQQGTGDSGGSIKELGDGFSAVLPVRPAESEASYEAYIAAKLKSAAPAAAPKPLMPGLPRSGGMLPSPRM